MKAKSVLWVIDPNDPIVSKDQIIETYLFHYKKGSKLFVQLLEYCPILYNRLKNITILLPPFSQTNRTTLTTRIRPIKIPLHIRYAYYKYPNLVEIYWRHIKETLWKDTRYYHEVVIFSQGLAELYVRDRINYQKVYIHIHCTDSVFTHTLWQDSDVYLITNSPWIHYIFDKRGYTILYKKDSYEHINSASITAVKRRK